MQALEEIQIRHKPVFTIDEAIHFKPIDYYIQPEKRAVSRHFGFHPFFTTRPYNVVREYINHFTKPGDLVLDPFAGSGVTLIEALALRRKAIAFDINTIAYFIVKCKAIAPVNIQLLIETFSQIKEAISEKVITLDKLPDEEIYAELKNHWYPQNPISPEVDQDKVFTVDKLFTPRQLLGLSIIKESIDKVQNETIRDLLLLTFSAALTKANRTYVSPKDRSGRLRGQARFLQHYKFSIPRSMYEVNPWEAFEARFKFVVRAKIETNKVLDDFVNEKTFRLYLASARDLGKFIPEKTVDYIFTDPPYGSSIAYLDLSIIWTSWLGLEQTDYQKKEEIIEGGSFHKTQDKYLSLLRDAIIAASKTLKEDSWFSLVYANKDPKIWGNLMAFANEAGLVLENVVPQPNTVLPSVTKIKNPFTTLSGELILNFRKQTLSRRAPRKVLDIPNATKFFKAETSRIIVRHLGATTDEICFGVISKLLSSGLLDTAKDLDKLFGEQKTLIEFLDKSFMRYKGYWHLIKLEKPQNIQTEEWIRYLVFRSLLEKESTLEEINHFVMTYLSTTYVNVRLLDIIRQVAKQGKTGWVLNPDLLIQLKLPLGDIPETEKPRKSELQKYKEAYEDDPLFKIKPLPLGKTNSSQIHDVLPDW